MIRSSAIFIVGFVSLTYVLVSHQECIINVNDKNHLAVKVPYPLFLDSNNEFVRASSDKNSYKRKIVLPKEYQMNLACTGSRNYLTVLGPNKSEATATCVSEQYFKVDDLTHHIKDLRCKEWPISTQQRSGSCYNNNTEFQIGFYLQSENFVPLITICHNETISETLYTQFLLTSDAGDHQRHVERPRYFNNKFMLNNAHKKYTNQDKIFIKLFGENQTYVNKKEQRFLTKGHLAAKADFLFGAQQRSTFWLTNTAPQWMKFNSGSWLSIEEAVRYLAMKSDKDLMVYTGTFENLYLLNEDGEYVSLYLNDGTSSKKMPIPKYFWKVVRDPSSNNAIAFIGVNNIYLDESETEETQEYFCKENVCDQVEYLRKTSYNVSVGHLFCCNVDEFREIVNFLPEFPVKGLLKS